MRFARAIALFLLLITVAVAVGAEYRGNTKSRAFHQSSCRYFTCKNCTAVFKSVDEAIQGGYHACGSCRPSTSTQNLADVENAYSGNTSSRKFHRSGCRYFTCKNCTARFDSREEAVKAGYSPGACCNP
jgi:transcription elongation factor Elf1